MKTVKVGTRVYSRKFGTGTVVGIENLSLAVRFDKENYCLHNCRSLSGTPLCEAFHGYWCLLVKNFSKPSIFYAYEVVLLKEGEVWD